VEALFNHGNPEILKIPVQTIIILKSLQNPFYPELAEGQS